MIIKVFIQNEKRSRFRNQYDEKTLKYIKTNELAAPATYQYGFIPGTLGEDGDCIDSWLIAGDNYPVGTGHPCRVLGMLEMFEDYKDEHEQDFKVFVSPESEDNPVTQEVITEIKQYTRKIFAQFPEVTITFGDFLPAKKAEEFILNKTT